MTSPQRAKTVTDVRSRIIESDPTHRPVFLVNTSNETVYLGDSTVTTANGLPIIKHSAPLSGALGPGQDLWAVCEAGKTADLRIFTTPEDA
jgi:hypothetical protein